MKSRFEMHDNQLFRMLDKPIPIPICGSLPILIRGLKSEEPYVLSKHTNELILTFILEQACNFEIIGYPVVEGSKEWALYQMMQGLKVCNPQLAKDKAARFECCDDETFNTYWYIVSDTVVEGKSNYATLSVSSWLFAASSTGWQIYKEPETPQYKVGDWVEWCGCQYMVESAPPKSDHYNIRSPYEELGCSVYPENITRKLKPSEVVIHIGCMSGTVLFVDADRFILRGIGNSEMSNACIMFKMLDATTRELVESLLNAQKKGDIK